jgi:hypothetical protein
MATEDTASRQRFKIMHRDLPYAELVKRHWPWLALSLLILLLSIVAIRRRQRNNSP